jgi:asparagine synthase (glutamine-hydrolysing)
VQRLPLAHAMQVSATGLRSWRYWFPEQLEPVRYASMADCRAAFVETLVTATRARLRSNSPVGAMLSGGMDSSSIVALIGKYCRDDLTQPLHTFSLVNAERAACLDWPYIQVMLQDKQLVPTVLDSALSDEQMAALFAKLSTADNPYMGADALTSAVMAHAAQAQQVQVLLDGGAGDHLFLSPETSLEVVFSQQRWGSLWPVWQGYRRHGIAGFAPTLLRKVLRAALPAALIERYRQQQQQQRWLMALQQEPFLHALPRATAQAYWQQRQTLQQARVTAMAASRTECPQLGDLLSPMFGFAYEVGESVFGDYQVEQRGPYSDRRVMEFAFTMPVEAKLALGWYKSFLRESMQGILPEAVRTRMVVGGHPGHAFHRRYLAFAKRQRPEWFKQSAQLASSAHVLGVPAPAAGQLAGSDELLFRLGVLQEWLASLK